MTAKDVPDWVVDIISNQAKVIEANTSAINTWNSNMPKFVDALNAKFDAHNVDTVSVTKEFCGKLEANTKAIEVSTKAQDDFRTQQFEKMWNLIERVVIAAVLVLGGTYGGAELIKVLTGSG